MVCSVPNAGEPQCRAPAGAALVFAQCLRQIVFALVGEPGARLSPWPGSQLAATCAPAARIFGCFVPDRIRVVD